MNYGNHLQAYALNLYVRRMNAANSVESILLPDKQIVKYTNVLSWSFCKKVFWSLHRRIKARIFGETVSGRLLNNDTVKGRLASFAEFRSKYIPTTQKQTRQYDYDVMIAGSDVVWYQYEHKVRRIQFLDFKGNKKVTRVSYAASFGCDTIPKENVKIVRDKLKKFYAISVREKSSVQMLQEIGIQDVSYCLDPTLLLDASEWELLEKKPKEIQKEKPFVFVYLLGDSREQRTEISSFAKKSGWEIAAISYPNGRWDAPDFGDVRITDCSIENWLWLVHHAQAVITDSFHGVVFSTIFEKTFYALERNGDLNFGNRIPDYLREIGQADKLIPMGSLQSSEKLVWDYECIRTAIDERRKASKAFLEKALGTCSK